MRYNKCPFTINHCIKLLHPPFFSIDFDGSWYSIHSRKKEHASLANHPLGCIFLVCGVLSFEHKKGGFFYGYRPHP